MINRQTIIFVARSGKAGPLLKRELALLGLRRKRCEAVVFRRNKTFI